ncbi:MAG TPA: trehalose-6-phosphate synthase, partial [Elusimicrobiota bacterium]|nr:trehalose-6-phosphate synthase [Elusimicrobiota bacterium]
PLCHIAHTRPVFRPEDWDAYREVNEKFARAVLAEIEGKEEPFVLVQDYHFTLLPALVKARRPDARIALFWHIPWPTPEVFGICPWSESLLEGMLGADLIGFHTQHLCNNFLDTADTFLECRIDRERFGVERRDHTTLVKPFPISVAFPAPTEAFPDREAERLRLRAEHGVQARFLAVGVDRLDYTKGILERFRGVERFLDRYPRYRGQFALLQVGAPSRAEIPRYRQLLLEVEAEAARINARLGSRRGAPIVLLKRHHSHAQIRAFYRAADVCMVTSLHDGMNLVAKEFVAAREDERGALILSRFTGAARELRDALVVNPYDVNEMAEALRGALEMDLSEQAMRMVRMRAALRENNIYFWAGNLISELAAVRVRSPAMR